MLVVTMVAQISASMKLRIYWEHYMKYVFLFRDNTLHFSITNKFCFCFLWWRHIVFFPSRYKSDLFIRENEIQYYFKKEINYGIKKITTI